jgi:predicted NBD/HSP70 family sugar kinase
MVRAIGRGIRMLVAGLAPEEIVVVGDITRMWRRFGPAIEEEMAAGLVVGKPPRIRPGEGRMARLRGTVALVLQKHFGPSALEAREQGSLSERIAV